MLSQVIQDAAAATPEEIAEAKKNFPTSGTVEALGFHLGEEREKQVISRIASELKIGVLGDDEVLIEFSVSDVSFGPLVTKFKATPLMVAGDSQSKRKVMLAMADPCDETAVVMFAELFSAEVVTCIAREKAITNAYKKFAEPKTSTNTEVRKEVRQIVGTAVKHDSSEVRFALREPFTRVRFTLADGNTTSAEISVEPEAVAATLIESAQIVASDLDGPRFGSRYNFSSAAVDIELQLLGDEVVIDSIKLDEVLQPCFWKSISKVTRSRLMRVMDDAHGVVIVGAAEPEMLTDALRAISGLYSEALILKNKPELLLDNAVYERSVSSVVVLPMLEADVFNILAYGSELSSEQRRCLKAVFCFDKLPRICPCCSEIVKPSEARLQKLPNYLDRTGEYQRGSGCVLCHKEGFLGKTWLASGVLLNKSVGAKFIDGEELYQSLTGANFETPLAGALQLAQFGRTTLDVVLEQVPNDPVEYVEAKQEWNEDVLPDPEMPLTGRKVFTEREKVRSGGKTILVIDDDPDQRAIISRVLELEGYCIELAEDGIDGLVTAARVKPDLIIVDFMMPEMDGTETVRRLKSGVGTKEIPIIALTAYPDSEIEFSLLDAGADDFCSKSISKKILLKRVDRLTR